MSDQVLDTNNESALSFDDEISQKVVEEFERLAEGLDDKDNQNKEQAEDKDKTDETSNEEESAKNSEESKENDESESKSVDDGGTEAIQNILEGKKSETKEESTDDTESDKGVPQHLRQVIKDYSRQVKNLEKQLEAKNKAEVAAANSGTQPELQTNQAVLNLIRVNSGELDEQYRIPLQQELEKHSSKDLSDLVKIARSGAFGDKSQDVLDVANSYLNTALINERDQQELVQKQKEESESTERVQEIRNESLNEVRKQPGMADENSEQFKAYRDFLLVLKDKNPDLLLSANAPMIAYKLMVSDQLSTQNSELSKKVEELNKKLTVQTSPQSGENAESSSSKDGKSSSRSEALQEAVNAINEASSMSF